MDYPLFAISPTELIVAQACSFDEHAVLQKYTDEQLGMMVGAIGKPGWRIDRFTSEGHITTTVWTNSLPPQLHRSNTVPPKVPFSTALELMRYGLPVARIDWHLNAPDHFITLSEKLRLHSGADPAIFYPTPADMFATDWCIYVPRPVQAPPPKTSHLSVVKTQ